MSDPCRGRIPKYQHFKARNLAKVRIDGRDIYLGEYDSQESHSKYKRVIAEWLVQKQEVPDKRDEITICELMVCYLKHAKAYYVKDGEPTREFGCICEALRPLRQMYELTTADEFGPLSLQALRQAMVNLEWSRKYVNKQTGRVVRMFRWGVSRELVKSSTYESLRAVEGLKKGRTEAIDHEPVKPVTEARVNAVLPRLPEVIADMVRFQRLAGCRPGEVCSLRPMDVDRTGDVWTYTPESHKTQHHGRERFIFIGPKAQQVLLPYLLRDSDEYCFNPRDSERKRRKKAQAARTTPLSCGNVPSGRMGRTGRKYSAGAYRKAIHRACDKVSIPRWSPNQLRHATATEIRREFGLEAAQVILGHSSADVTQVYAERNHELAAVVARKIG